MSAPRGRARFTLLALALVLAVTALGLRRGHRADTAVFAQWYADVRASRGALYRTARADVNYPVLGAQLALVPGRLLGPGATPAAYHAALKLALAPLLLAQALASLAVLRALGAVPGGARRAALALLASPATWVLGSYFGNLDGVVSLLQSASVLAGLAALERASRDEGSRGVAARALLATLLGSAALLTKQLGLFALPQLVALALAPAALLALRRRAPAALRAGLAALAGLGALVAFDPWLALPPGYRSHLRYVFFGAGPAHADEVGNAPGLWCLLASGGASSDEPFTRLGLTPRLLGHGLFLAAYALVSALGLAACLRALRSSRALDAGAALVRAAGLAHLTMALFVPGAHERYAGNALPLLFFAAAREGRGRLVLAASAVYGLHVLATLEYEAFGYGPLALVRAPTPAALALFALFFVEARALARDATRARPEALPSPAP